MQVFQVRNSVNIKTSYGGTSTKNIKKMISKLNRELKPDLVFMPCVHDLHQDHSVVANEGLRAFKKTSILAYEIPWNNFNFSTQCFSVLKKHHINKKIT